MSLANVLALMAAPVFASGISFFAKAIVERSSDWLRHFRSTNLKVTLPGGKTEYLMSRSSNPEAQSHALADYFKYELTVQKALEAVASNGAEIRNLPDRADFKVTVNGRTFLIEAKTNPEATSRGELKALLREGPSDFLLFVTPQPLSDEALSRLKLDGENVAFASGRDVSTLKSQLRALMQPS